MFSCSHFLSSKREVGSGEAETNEFWYRHNLTSAKKDPPQDLSDPNSLGNQELDQSCVSVRARKLSARGEDNQFGSEGWSRTMCRSPIVGTLRKSSRICRKGWISQKTHPPIIEALKTNVLDLVTVYDDNNESRHSPWTKLHWEFGSFQEHELEELQNLFHITQMLVLHHQREILNVKTIERTSLSWTRSALSHMEYFPRTCVIGNPPENPWRPARSKHWTWEIRRTNHLHVDVQWCLMDKERKLSTTYFKFRTCRKNTGHSWTWRWKEMVWNSKFVHLKADGIPL